MEIIEYPDADMMMLALAGKLASDLRQALAVQERVSFAVPGGTTPGPVFEALAAVDLDWTRVHVMLTDERWVPEVSERSNTRLLRRKLLQDKAAAATLVPLYAEAPMPEDRLAELEAGIAAHLPLTVCLLGMGADMHTASIFPGADRLTDALSGPGILVPMRAPGAPEPRVTLTAQVLNGAMRRHILIIGAEKRAALQKARHLAAAEAPVAAVLKGSCVHWAES